MDDEVDELAADLMADPRVLDAYRGHSEEQMHQALLTLAEDMYLFGLDDDDDPAST